MPLLTDWPIGAWEHQSVVDHQIVQLAASPVLAEDQCQAGLDVLVREDVIEGVLSGNRIQVLGSRENGALTACFDKAIPLGRVGGGDQSKRVAHLGIPAAGSLPNGLLTMDVLGDFDFL